MINDEIEGSLACNIHRGGGGFLAVDDMNKRAKSEMIGGHDRLGLADAMMITPHKE